ncbi:hypothetical protein [Faunimonas pinastri]|uniref:hypothetical protein n=1 Tax=Faunimonas pinastri TaxID=1855383 RepID=UPI00115F8273|nr:hypothetical protein [Faunimonas pinastri]
MTHKSEMQDLIREYGGKGWLVSRASKHWKLVPPGGGKPVFASCTPSDHRSVLNTRSLLRRMNAQPTPLRYN